MQWGISAAHENSIDFPVYRESADIQISKSTFKEKNSVKNEKKENVPLKVD